MHLVLCWVDIGEEIWCGSLAGMMQGVCADIVVRQQLGLQVSWQFVEGSACIGEVGVAACVLWWEFVSFEDRKGGATGIERGVNMEEAVALVVLSSRGRWVERCVGLGVDVASVEELVILVSRFAAVGHVWTNVIEFTETARELDVSCVVHACGAEHDDSILPNQ